ncbi:MAG: DUF5110 domain-containing protein [Balneolaceae bacterium]|nr:MAG: DUF5110 domain-containing protein [Balneolaceae bacterium]
MRTKLISSLFTIFFIISCTNLPDSPFYEVDGMVSIKAASLEKTDGWELKPFQTSISKISRENPDTRGSLSFPFYIQRPGFYSVWVLSASITEDGSDNSINFRVMDEEGILLERFTLDLNSAEMLTWNRESVSGDLLQVRFDQPGHFRIVFESGGEGGVVIDKLHLTLNNQHPPFGFGYPETVQPGVDPVLAKRDQRVGLPPSWLFQPVCSSLPEDLSGIYVADLYDFASETNSVKPKRIRKQEVDTDSLLQNMQKMEAFFSENFSENRGLVFAEPVFLQDPDFKRFPTRWSIQDSFDFYEQIEKAANPRRSIYEVPFLIGSSAEVFDPSSDLFTEELLMRWVQFSAFHTIMFFPVDDVTVLKEALSDETYEHINGLIELRHRLYPYIYSLAHLIRATGVKPLRGFSQHRSQFRLGNAFLMAPHYREGMQQRAIYFPDGLWYRYSDGARYEGGQSWLVETPLNELPLFVKAGSIIPMSSSPVSGTALFDDLTVEIYTGGTGNFRLYEDDGLTNDYLQGGFTTTAFRYFEHTDYATFTIGRKFRHLDGQADVKNLTLKFKFISEPEFITAEDEQVERGTGENMWEYDGESQTLIINWKQNVHQKTDFFIQF